MTKWYENALLAAHLSKTQGVMPDFGCRQHQEMVGRAALLGGIWYKHRRAGLGNVKSQFPALGQCCLLEGDN